MLVYMRFSWNIMASIGSSPTRKVLLRLRRFARLSGPRKSGGFFSACSTRSARLWSLALAECGRCDVLWRSEKPVENPHVVCVLQ